MRILLFSLLLFGSVQSFACSCGVLDKITENEIENVGEVFIGIVKDVTVNDSNFTITATFEVKKYLKGKLQNSELKVTTSNSGASCGLNFKIGQKWYVFSHYSENRLYAGLCGRSVQLSKVRSKAKRIMIGRKNYRNKKRRVRHDKKSMRRYDR